VTATSTEAPDTRRIVAGCIAGDDAARAEFVNVFGGLIRAAVAGRLGQMSRHAPIRGDVEDISQEVFLKLFENGCARLQQVRDWERIHAWLVQVARNTTADYVRRWQNRLRLQDAALQVESPAPTPPTLPLEETEKYQPLHEAMGELESGDQLGLVLYYIHGMKYAEIAEITGARVDTVYVRLHRARKRLKKRLEETADGRR